MEDAKNSEKNNFLSKNYKNWLKFFHLRTSIFLSKHPYFFSWIISFPLFLLFLCFLFAGFLGLLIFLRVYDQDKFFKNQRFNEPFEFYRDLGVISAVTFYLS